MYVVIFGVGLVSLLPLVFVVLVGTSLVVSHLLKKHLIAAFAQIACITHLPALVQWSIGGIFDSGFLLVWGLCGPLVALMYFSVRQSALWLLLFLINVAITVVFNDHLAAGGLAVPDNVKVLFFWMNLTFASLIVFAFAGTFVLAALRER